MTAICPICGGAIRLVPDANPGANQAQIPDANQAQNGQIAQGSKIYNQGYDEPFLTFWAAYPLRRDKRKAQIAWRKSVSRLAQMTGANRADAMAQILAGAISYRNDPNRQEEYTKYAEGWLNGDGWEDEPLPVRLNGKEPAPKTITEDDYRRISRD